MKKPLLLAIGVLTALVLASSAVAALQYENILLPVPAGFKMGSRAEDSKKLLAEFVPNDESVDHWSTMITEIILRGNSLADPEVFQSKMQSDWKNACPGGEGHPLSNSMENGYRVSYWGFNCPLNPKTNSNEFMVRKVIIGADALYEVQFAYRKTVTAELTQSAISYLHTVTVCDTRTRDHPCPNGLTPVAGSADPAPNPVAAFLRAADVNDFESMKSAIDPGSANFLRKIGNCYLRRVYSNTQSHELIAAWMCSEGQGRSRVVIANIAAVSASKVSVSVQLDQVNNRPAPERAGSAFAN